MHALPKRHLHNQMWLFDYCRVLNIGMSLLQPPVRFQDLRMVAEHTTAWGDALLGLCSDAQSKLYTVERREEASSYAYRLCVYHIGTATLKLLDSAQVKVLFYCHPHYNRQSQYVYVPCGDEGVWIFRCLNSRLVTVKKLRCVKNVKSVAAKTADTVIVSADHVFLINVKTDNVIRRFQTPRYVTFMEARHVAVLGDSVLVCYAFNTLVIYDGDGCIERNLYSGLPIYVRNVHSISTDNHSSFLVAGKRPQENDENDYHHYVWILDDKGDLRLRIDSARPGIRGCAVVQSQLWMGHCFGSIDVMSQ